MVIPPIPPYAENYEVIGITAYTKPVTIYQFQPHAHLRGKDFSYAVVYPDGREETVLNVPKYNFHWQLAYDLDTPLKLPAGSKLVVTAHYDNSLKNDHLLHHGVHNAGSTEQNFGPEKEVYFRDQNQSWDEMFSPFIQFSVDSQNPATVAQPHDSQSEQTNAGQQEAPREGEHARYRRGRRLFGAKFFQNVDIDERQRPTCVRDPGNISGGIEGGSCQTIGQSAEPTGRYKCFQPLEP